MSPPILGDGTPSSTEPDTREPDPRGADASAPEATAQDTTDPRLVDSSTRKVHEASMDELAKEAMTGASPGPTPISSPAAPATTTDARSESGEGPETGQRTESRTGPATEAGPMRRPEHDARGLVPNAVMREGEDLVVMRLKQVNYLSNLDDNTLGNLARKGTRVTFAQGDCVVAELETGADIYVILSGEAEVYIEPTAGERRVMGEMGPGQSFGEMASLTGELRSASVAAKTPLEVLVIADADFDALRVRHPGVAVALTRILGERLAVTEKAIETLLTPGQDRTDAEAVADASHQRVERGSIARAFQELVINRKRDLTFLTLAGFVLALISVRTSVFLAFHYHLGPRLVVRAAYLTGFALIGASALTALLTYRPSVRRVVALAYGIGMALIFNELGVTLAFDIFFKDIHTADPSVPFDIERIYRRTEPLRAIGIGLVVMIQAAYLRRFYRRAAFIVRMRLRRLFAKTT